MKLNVKLFSSEQAKVGGSGAGVLHFAIAERQQGDAENRLLALVFAGPVATLQERQAQAIAQVLGTTDKVVGTQHGA